MALSHNEIVYKGYVGKLEQKEGDGEESYRGQQGYENYLGPFKRDAYNGRSNYFANSIKRGLWAYSGDFHSNSIEGYGAMSYGDATYFAGLFKYDKPFGPGVLTYTNGRQDVGIWCGSQIYRLCTTVGSIEKLTNSPQDRLQVTKFKKLIAINEPPRDIASTLLKALRSSEDQYIDPSVLYSRFCKDPRSYFYDHNYFNDDLSDLQEIEKALSEKDKSEAKLTPDTYTPATKFVNTGIVEVDRDVHKSEEEEEEEEEDFYETQQTSKKTLKENADQVFVLTWNNTPKVINIMKHSFKYRQLEESETFDIGNILCGRRKLFRTRGPKEIASIKILEASASNDVITILKQLKRHTLNVDVMDNKGNSMILRAAAHDALDVMQMLHILGADIDAVNDEGFSALTHTLTRYIALTYDVNNWSQGFLARSQSEEDEDQEDNWLDYCMQSNFSLNPGSAVSFGQRSGSKMKKRPRSDSKASLRFPRKVSIADEPSTEYVFDLGPEPPCTKLKKLNLSSDAESEKNQKLEVIMGTAFYLLDIGADIHVSVTPAPIMVLAIFSGNVQIVEKLLRCGADANELHSLNNGFLTALHIIAQARPLPAYPAMVNLFLRYGADPNHRTSENYNMSEWEYLLDHVKLPHSLAPGLTPLQIIAMRSDATYVTNKENSI